MKPSEPFSASTKLFKIFLRPSRDGSLCDERSWRADSRAELGLSGAVDEAETDFCGRLMGSVERAERWE
jgi:hypothetical protein